MTLQVHQCSNEIDACRKRWAILEALYGGTRSMRDCRQTYLPKWPAEEDDSYNLRISVATLFPAWARTLSVMSGKPFSEPVTLSDDAPPQVVQWSQDIDLQGTSLHSFAAEMFEETVGFGLAGVLVDYPDTRPRDDQGQVIPGPQPQRTVAQVEAEGLRPYWVRIKHEQILGWKAQNIGGKMRLTQLRILETYEEEVGDYGVECKPQVRVLRPGSWETWRATDTKAWVLADSGTTSLTVIPFVPFYGKRESFMVGSPPLLELGYLNVKHWQSQSDQDTILHVARVPILAIIGADEESKVVVGASSACKLPINAEMKFVEHTGAAIQAGADSLKDLEDQMIQSGAELLVKKPGDRSATESANDAEGNKSDLQRIAENFEDSLDQALWLTAQYAGLPDGGSVELFSDYGAATLTDASAQLVLSLQQGGVISKKTTIEELKRRGVLAEKVDAEEEASAVEEDGPPLGMLADLAANEGDEPADGDE